MSQSITPAEYRALTQGRPRRKGKRSTKIQMRSLPSTLPLGAVFELLGDDGHTHGFIMAELGGECSCGAWITREFVGELGDENRL